LLCFIFPNFSGNNNQDEGQIMNIIDEPTK